LLGGERGERDSLGSVEAVEGGPRSDVLLGDRAPNSLSGGSGRDTLRGRAGADSLDGGRGPDRLSGGSGNDFLFAGEDAARDAIRCHSGRDTVANTDARDLVPRDCERFRFVSEFFLVGPPRRDGRRAVRIRAAVSKDFDPDEDSARIALYRGRKLLGRSRLIRRSGTITIRLNRAGRHATLRSGTIVVLREDSFDEAYATRLQ
jgi:Ca2+-binding RTX toxin-like protein